jgi:hypothetical protein
VIAFAKIVGLEVAPVTAKSSELFEDVRAMALDGLLADDQHERTHIDGR